MKKSILLSVALMCSMATGVYGADNVNVNNKLSPYTTHFLQLLKHGTVDKNGMLAIPAVSGEGVALKDAAQPRRMLTQMESVGGAQMVEGIIKLAEGGTVADIEAAGVVVKNEIGDLLVVEMPADQIEQLAQLESVAQVDVAKPVRLFNDESRASTNITTVHAGGGNLEQAYTGEGVIVGIIDSGIDFNHINFKDEEGNSRVVRAFVGTDSYGNGNTYETASDIAQLTSDLSSSTHGTHVAGTAAGSYTGNGLQGMAPGADLYLCGLGQGLTDASIVSQIDNIVTYAQQQEQPVVINMSLGGNTGSHMGTDAVSQAIDRLAGEGVLFCVSSGNEGDCDLYINKTFENADDEEQFKTIVFDDYYGNQMYYTYIDCYTQEPVDVELLVVDTRSNNEILYSTDKINVQSGYWSLGLSDSYDDFSTYFQVFPFYSDVMIEEQLDEASGKYQTFISAMVAMQSNNTNGRYKLGLRFYGKQGDEMNMWTDSNSGLTDNGSDEFVAGTPDGSINDMATSDNAISVGAYVTKRQWRAIDSSGNEFDAYYRDDTEELNTMASFSSYGYDMNGVWHPTISAPGYVIASSFNRYAFNQAYNFSYNNIVSQVKENGNTYYWGINQGTSMASPAVTGILATWLQYDPTLTPNDVKEIFAATAQKNEHYGTNVALQWGPNGFIDAYAGLCHMMGVSGVNDVAKSQDNVLVYPNPTSGQFKVFAQGEEQVTLGVYSTSGAKVFSQVYTTNGGNIDVDLQGVVPSGIYVLQLQGERCNYTGKLVIE